MKYIVFLHFKKHEKSDLLQNEIKFVCDCDINTITYNNTIT